MKSARQLCVLTIASVSVATALLPSLAGAAGRRQPVIYPQPSQQAVAGTFMSLEGGLACQFDGQSTIASGEQVVGVGGVDTLPELARANFNGNDCGWTGRVGFGQDRVQILGGMFDSWAIFGRHTEFGDHKLKASGAAFFDPLVPGTFRNDFTGKSDANRTVIDLEVGKNLGVGTGIRIFGGLRYARFEQNARLNGAVMLDDGTGAGFAPINGFDANMKSSFEGIGPRIGLTSRARFGGGWGIMVSGSAAALYGDIDGTITATHGPFAPVTTTSHVTSSGWVTSYEGEAAITLQTSIPGEFALGARIEAWYGETKSNQSGTDCTPPAGNDTGCTRLSAGDRVNWGPFARWKIYLD